MVLQKVTVQRKTNMLQVRERAKETFGLPLRPSCAKT